MAFQVAGQSNALMSLRDVMDIRSRFRGLANAEIRLSGKARTSSQIKIFRVRQPHTLDVAESVRHCGTKAGELARNMKFRYFRCGKHWTWRQSVTCHTHREQVAYGVLRLGAMAKCMPSKECSTGIILGSDAHSQKSPPSQQVPMGSANYAFADLPGTGTVYDGLRRPVHHHRGSWARLDGSTATTSGALGVLAGEAAAREAASARRHHPGEYERAYQ